MINTLENATEREFSAVRAGTLSSPFNRQESARNDANVFGVWYDDDLQITHLIDLASLSSPKEASPIAVARSECSLLQTSPFAHLTFFRALELKILSLCIGSCKGRDSF